MFQVDINYWAVLVIGVMAMALGYVWYSQSVFGRIWMKLTGKSEAELQGYGSQTILKAFLSALLAGYILAHFVNLVGATTLYEGMITGFWAWLGFSATTLFINDLYEGRPLSLWAINAGYQLVFLSISGAILVSWI